MAHEFSIPPDELARQKMLLKSHKSSAKREGQSAQPNGKLNNSSSSDARAGKPTDVPDTKPGGNA